MIDQQLADATILRGNQAEDLLSSPVFAAVVNRLSEEHLAAVMASTPGAAGREVRERHHVLHYALTEIVDTLRQDIALREDMKLQIAAQSDDEQEDI